MGAVSLEKQTKQTLNPKCNYPSLGGCRSSVLYEMNEQMISKEKRSVQTDRQQVTSWHTHHIIRGLIDKGNIQLFEVLSLQNEMRDDQSLPYIYLFVVAQSFWLCLGRHGVRPVPRTSRIHYHGPSSHFTTSNKPWCCGKHWTTKAFPKTTTAQRW